MFWINQFPEIAKAVGHKYLRRTAKPGGGYRYTYAGRETKPEVARYIRLMRERGQADAKRINEALRQARSAFGRGDIQEFSDATRNAYIIESRARRSMRSDISIGRAAGEIGHRESKARVSQVESMMNRVKANIDSVAKLVKRKKLRVKRIQPHQYVSPERWRAQ